MASLVKSNTKERRDEDHDKKTHKNVKMNLQTMPFSYKKRTEGKKVNVLEDSK